MTDSGGALTAPTVEPRERERQRERGPSVPAAPPPPGRPRWTPGRVTALAVGTILIGTSIGLLGAGGTALWALTQRDAAGYVTSGEHAFSTGGSALVTVPAELDSPGIGWFYSAIALGNVRIRVTSVDGDSPLFVGIGPADRIAGYVDGVSHTVISDFWTERTRAVAGENPASPPGAEDFWAASSTGTGPRTVTWDAANGSWSIVVMNADGRPGVDVRADLAATFPALSLIAIVSVVFGVVVLASGVLLVVGAIRRVRAAEATPR